jgi:hypothetical protein
MPLVTCPNCKGRVPSSAQSCMHCGQVAASCPDCSGTGLCPVCEDDPPAGLAPCLKCKGNGKCPACKGNKVRWPDSA